MWRYVGFLLKLAKIGFFDLKFTEFITYIYIEGVILHFFATHGLIPAGKKSSLNLARAPPQHP